MNPAGAKSPAGMFLSRLTILGDYCCLEPVTSDTTGM
jgi:hypothetical protein